MLSITNCGNVYTLLHAVYYSLLFWGKKGGSPSQEFANPVRSFSQDQHGGHYSFLDKILMHVTLAFKAVYLFWEVD